MSSLGGGSFSVAGPELPPAVIASPGDDRLPRTFSLWRPQPVAPGNRDYTWRMTRFHGVRQGIEPELAAGGDEGKPCCVVLDDAGLGFRDDPARWPSALRDPAFTGQIILKMTAPLASGPLWDHLIASHSERLTVCLAVGDLRKGDAAIGQPLSWERLAREVAAAVQCNEALSDCGQVIVTLGLAGAVLVARQRPATLVFDPLHQEGDWERSRPGTMPGLGTCLAAALALEVVRDQSPAGWTRAIMRGLTAGRRVHEVGYEPTLPDGGEIGFPIFAAVDALSAEIAVNDSICVATIEDDPDWQLLPLGDPAGALGLARQIVIEGDRAACQGVPVERMGAWTSIDRTEIESVRSLRTIIRQYLSHAKRSRPLSVAVFGPPGSGKSFAVKQMANEWMASGTQIEVLEMNVAQFGSPADLAMALQRVRDAAVEGTLPLVFWDEFDSPHDGKELGWLARFLAPMQDGVFLDGGIARPIGPAVFIFAGGTHATLASFKERSVTIPGAKASDFLSRLRGHVDVLGPNPRDARDRGYVLRRALLLRAQLLGRQPRLVRGSILSIDPGVLRAFLRSRRTSTARGRSRRSSR